MKEIRELIALGLVTLAVITGGVYLGTLHLKSQGNSFGDTTVGNRYTSAVNTSVGMGASATSSLVSANSARNYVDICNDNGVSTKFYISFGNTAATSTGVLLTGGNCYEVRDVNNYVGQITGFNASSSAATATLITIP